MTPAHAQSEIVLLGGGHSHVFVLKAFGERPIPGVRLTIVAKDLAAPYSGMIPGFVAGHYEASDCNIDLVQLARFAGARLVHGAATAVDQQQKLVAVDGEAPVPYDLLSINVGVTPAIEEIAGAEAHALAVKPISSFVSKWQALEARALRRDGPRKIAAIGGGAAGVELILAARHKLHTLARQSGVDPRSFSFALAAGTGLLPTHNARAQMLARRALAAADVDVIEDDLVTAITSTTISFASGGSIAADAALISTKAAAPGWFKTFGSPRDRDGFITTRPTLQLTDDDDVFAVGDCATIIGHPLPKAGVFAVRQGPVIAENLRRRVLGDAAQPYTPQKSYLSLISLGDKAAIASRGRFALAGRWAWRLKDYIDRSFMDQFNDLDADTPRDAQ